MNTVVTLPQSTSETTSQRTTDTPRPRGPDVVVGLAGVDVDVSNAVAPFDHESNVDSQLLEFALAGARNQVVFDCLRDEGFDEYPDEVSLPDRDDPLLMANLSFPATDRLEVGGFPAIAPSSDGEIPTGRSAAEQEASRECAASVIGSETDQRFQLFGSVRSGWEGVLAEIETLPEISKLKGDFAACLGDEGIPPDRLTEGGFLGYVDSLRMEAGADEEEEAAVRDRLGRLYAKCGRSLFEAREALRSGDRRTAFLSENESAIRELSDALFGG